MLRYVQVMDEGVWLINRNKTQDVIVAVTADNYGFTVRDFREVGMRLGLRRQPLSIRDRFDEDRFDGLNVSRFGSADAVHFTKPIV